MSDSKSNDITPNDEMKIVAHFMARKFMQDIEQRPGKESFIEFRPEKDFRKPNPLNHPWDKCNAFVTVSWDPKWLIGLKVIFGAFTPRPDDMNAIHEEIAPNTKNIVKNFQTQHGIKDAYPFPKECLSTQEIQSIFDSIINDDNLIYVTKTW